MLIAEILCLFAIYASVGIFRYITTRGTMQEGNIVTLHPAYAVLGVVISLICCILSFVAYNAENMDTAVAIFSFVMALIGPVFVLGYLGYRITYDEEKITYRCFFEKPKTIYYKDVVDLKMGMDLKIKTIDRTLRIKNDTVNFKKMFTYIEPRVEKRVETEPKPVPKVRKYADSVERPGEFVVLYVVWLTLCAVFWIMAFWAVEIIYFAIFVTVFSGIYTFSSIYSAKRAHSSEFWRKIAYLCYRPGYLVDDPRLLSQEEEDEKHKDDESDF